MCKSLLESDNFAEVKFLLKKLNFIMFSDGEKSIISRKITGKA